MGCGGSKTIDEKGCIKKEGNQSQKQEQEQVVKNTVIFILGGPGSGKGTQCSELTKHYGFIHISTGDLLREAKDGDGPNAKYIAETMASGGLVKSDILVEIIADRFKKSQGEKFLLDGFPRSQENIDSWKKIIDTSVETPLALYFNCSHETMKSRILERSKTSGRADDNEEAIINRLKVFEEQTLPILHFFESKNKLVRIDCESAPKEVFKSTEQHLKEKKII